MSRKGPSRLAQVGVLESTQPGTRLCYGCSTLLPLDEFNRISQPDIPLKRVERKCTACRRKRSCSDRSRIYGLFYQAKLRAETKGLAFTITEADIVIPDTCPVFGIPLRWGTRCQRDHSPSIDRIDNSKGYTPDNIVIVSWLANNIKGKFSLSQLQQVIDFYDRYEQ